MKRHERMREELLHGPLVRALVKLAVPTSATAALSGMVAAIDVIMVGRLGETAMAAVTTSRQAVMVLMVAASAIGVGGGALVAQAIGRGDREGANHVLTQALLSFFGFVAFILAPFGWFATPYLAGWLAGGDEGVTAVAVPYMRLVICGSLLTLVGMCGSSALRGAGDTRTPLRLALLANCLHVPCNYVFIFGLPRWGLAGHGVIGAAIGTAVSQAIANLALLALLFRGGLAVTLQRPRHWRLDPQVLWAMARIGLPASLSSIILNLNGLLVIGILARTGVGTLAVAAYGLSNTYRNFGTWATWGLADATMAMVGQNLGARQRRRARAAGFAAAKLAAAFLTVLGVFMALTSQWIFPLVLHEPDPQRELAVVAIGVQYMLTQIAALPFLGVGMTLEGALRGAGDAMAAMLNNAMSFLIVGIPLCAFLALDRLTLGPLSLPGLGHGPLGVWIGMVASVMVRGCSMWLKWRRTRWSAGTGTVL